MNYLGLREVIIEPAEVKRHGIFVARVLVDNTQRVPLRIVNITSQEVILSKSTVLGHTIVTNNFQKLNINTVDINKKKRNIETYFTLNHLDNPQREKITNLLRRYDDIFLTEGVPPITKAPYRVPHSQRRVLQDQIKQVLEGKIIEHSNSPWSAPVIMVSKKSDGEQEKYRLCIDYRGLNLVTKRDYFPLPRLQDIFEQFGQATIFSTLDLASSYWQIEVEEKSKQYTAFSTPDGPVSSNAFWPRQ